VIIKLNRRKKAFLKGYSVSEVEWETGGGGDWEKARGVRREVILETLPADSSACKESIYVWFF
jgi:hypothetical protein